MPTLRFHFNSEDNPENDIKSILDKLREDSEISEVERSKEMAMGLGEIVIGIRVVQITYNLINRLRAYLKREDHLEFKCGDKKVKIEGKLSSEEVKQVYSALCGDS